MQNDSVERIHKLGRSFGTKLRPVILNIRDYNLESSLLRDVWRVNSKLFRFLKTFRIRFVKSEETYGRVLGETGIKMIRLF